MDYEIVMTREALEDVSNLSKYMIDTFKNRKAADDFLDAYDEQVEVLGTFPIGYRGITLKQKTNNYFHKVLRPNI